MLVTKGHGDFHFSILIHSYNRRHPLKDNFCRLPNISAMDTVRRRDNEKTKLCIEIFPKLLI